jgi:hypothetical protein
VCVCFFFVLRALVYFKIVLATMLYLSGRQHSSKGLVRGQSTVSGFLKTVSCFQKYLQSVNTAITFHSRSSFVFIRFLSQLL